MSKYYIGLNGVSSVFCLFLVDQTRRKSGVRDRLRARDIAASKQGRRAWSWRKSVVAGDDGRGGVGRRKKRKNSEGASVAEEIFAWIVVPGGVSGGSPVSKREADRE